MLANPVKLKKKKKTRVKNYSEELLWWLMMASGGGDGGNRGGEVSRCILFNTKRCTFNCLQLNSFCFCIKTCVLKLDDKLWALHLVLLLLKKQGKEQSMLICCFYGQCSLVNTC